jgi:hypothetical protein
MSGRTLARNILAANMGKRPAAAILARRRAWLARYPGNQWTGKIKLDFPQLAINLSFTKKSCFTLKRKG